MSGSKPNSGNSNRDRVIKVLNQNRGLRTWTCAELAAACNVSPEATYNILQKMVTDGYVTEVGNYGPTGEGHRSAAMCYRRKPPRERKRMGKELGMKPDSMATRVLNYLKTVPKGEYRSFNQIHAEVKGKRSSLQAVVSQMSNWRNELDCKKDFGQGKPIYVYRIRQEL